MEDKFLKDNLKNFKNLDYERDIDIKVIFLTLIRQKKLLLISIFSGLFISFNYLFFKKPIYQGDFQIVISETSNNKLDQTKLELLTGKSSSGIKTEIKILESPSVLLPVFEYAKKIKQEKGIDTSKMSFGKWRRESFAVELTRLTKVLNVSYRDTDKESIMPIASFLSKSYQQYSRQGRNKSLENAINYLSEQIILFKEKSNLSFDLAQKYAIENNLTPPSPINSLIKVNPELKGLINNFTSTEQSRVQAIARIKDLKSNLKRINSFNDSENNLIFLKKNFGNLNIMKDIESLEEEIATKSAVYKENDPSLKKTIKMRALLINKLKQQVILNIKEDIISAEDSLAKAQRPKEVLSTYSQLMKEYSRNESTLNQLEIQYNNTKLEQARQEEPWRLISEPSLRQKQVSPITSYILFSGSTLGLFFGSLFCLMKERLKGIIYYKDEIKSYFKSPCLISSFKNFNLDKSVKLLSFKIMRESKDDSLAFLAINNQTKKHYDEFYTKISKHLKEIDTSLITEVSDITKFDRIIILFLSGKITHNEINNLNNLLSLNNNVIGWIFDEIN